MRPSQSHSYQWPILYVKSLHEYMYLLFQVSCLAYHSNSHAALEIQLSDDQTAGGRTCTCKYGTAQKKKHQNTVFF